MPKKHVLALSAVVVVAVGAAVLMPKKSDKAPTEAPSAQAQLPLGQGGNGAPAIEFAGSSQPMPLPLVGQSQPVMREPLAQAAGMGDGEEPGLPATPRAAACRAAAVPPTVTTIAPPQGVQLVRHRHLRSRSSRLRLRQACRNPAPKPVAPQACAGPNPGRQRQAGSQAAEKPAAGGAGGSAGTPARSRQLCGADPRHQLRSVGPGVRQEQGGEYRYFKKNLQASPCTWSPTAASPAVTPPLAIKNLPAKVQAGKPWPRTVGSVQQELATAR
jgi:DamX protein